MPELDLRQPGFTYSASGLVTKKKERIQKLKEARDSKYIYQNELDKLCFQHDMAYGDFKELPRRSITDKILHEKALILLKIRNKMYINVDLLKWFIIFFDKKTALLADKPVCNENMNRN